MNDYCVTIIVFWILTQKSSKIASIVNFRSSEYSRAPKTADFHWFSNDLNLEYGEKFRFRKSIRIKIEPICSIVTDLYYMNSYCVYSDNIIVGYS